MSKQWYYNRGGKTGGPVSDAELKQLVSNGQLSPSDTVWKQGFPTWVAADKIQGLFAAPSASAAAPLASAPSPATLPQPDPDVLECELVSGAGGPTSSVPAPEHSVAVELGLASAILGAVVLVASVIPVILAAALGSRSGAILMLVCLRAFSGLGVAMAIWGLVSATTNKSSGGALSLAGLCVSSLALVTSFMALIAIAQWLRAQPQHFQAAEQQANFLEIGWSGPNSPEVASQAMPRQTRSGLRSPSRLILLKEVPRRFYKQPHAFYAGVDLHARSMYTHILDCAGATVFERDLPASPEASSTPSRRFVPAWSSGSSACSLGIGLPTCANRQPEDRQRSSVLGPPCGRLFVSALERPGQTLADTHA